MATPPPFVFDFPYPAEPFNVFTENGSTDDYYYGGYEYVYEIPDDNTTTALEQPDAQLHVIIVPTVLFLICCVGIVGNCLVIFTIIRHVTMRLVTYLYLLNLAVVNIIYLLTSVPIQAVAYALTNWPFGRAACKVDGYVSSVCLAVSVLTLTATGLDRYMAVMHPVRSRTFRTERKAAMVILSIWLASMAVMAPRTLVFDVEELFNIVDFRQFCTRLQAGEVVRRMDTILMFIGTYLLPQLILAFCHLQIGMRLWTSQRPGVESQDVNLTALRERRRIAKIVFAITMAFGVGWLPMHIINLYEDFAGHSEIILFGNRAILVLCFSFGANAINPILYCLLSKHFRRRFKLALTCMGTNAARINQGNVHNTLTPVVAFRRQDQLERAVIINLDEDKYDDDNPASRHGETDSGEEAAMISAEKGSNPAKPGPSTRTPTQKRLAYLNVVPSTGSCPDSGHESEDEEEKATTIKHNGHPCGGVWVGVTSPEQKLPGVV